MSTSRQLFLTIATSIFALISVPSTTRAADRGDSIAAVSSVDGRLEVFVQLKDPQGGVYHSWQTTPSTSDQSVKLQWSGFEQFLPIPDPNSDIVAAREPGGRLLVGWLSGGSVWVSEQSSANSPFAAPRRLDTHGLHDLSVAANADGRLELFSLSSDGAAWSVAQSAPGSTEWSNHALLGHDLASIAPAAYGDGRIALVALGADRTVYWTTQYAPNGTWLDWSGLQGENIAAIAAGANADGRLDVVAIGGDGNLWERSQSQPTHEGYGSWSGWKVIAIGPFQGPMKMVANQDGRLEVFVRSAIGEPTHTWQKTPNGSWRDAPEKLLGVQNAFAIAMTTDQRLALAGLYSTVIFGKHEAGVTTTRQVAPNGGWALENSPGSVLIEPSPVPTIVISDFKATPDYVNQGSPSQLSWTLVTQGGCVPADLRITKKIYNEPEVLIYQVASPTSPGQHSVTPAGATLVPYNIYVSCSGGGAATPAMTSVTLAPAPPPAGPKVIINGPFTNPVQVHEKQPFTVTYWIENLGGAASPSADVQLLVDGVAEASTQSIPKLDPNQSASVQWNVTKELTGFNHTLNLRQGSADLSYAPFTVLP